MAELAAQYADMSNQFNPGYYQPLDNLKAKLDQSRSQLAEEIDRAAHEVQSDYSSTAARELMLEQDTELIEALVQASRCKERLAGPWEQAPPTHDR